MSPPYKQVKFKPSNTSGSDCQQLTAAHSDVLCFQFPAVNHPQTLERRYLGIIGGGLLDLLKVETLLFLA